MRINKFIAQALNISRRKADSLIKEGKVKLNGEIIKDFPSINESDTVEVNGKEIHISKGNVYFAFHKPPFVISSTVDKEGRKTVCNFFEGFEQKLICVGRLDYLSEGLLIVTSDGNFANFIMHPKFKIKKTYLVKTKDIISHSTIQKMLEGVELEDGFFKPLKVKQTNNPQWILISIDTGRNRIIRRFLKRFNIKIDRLKRISIGNIELGNLKSGEYRELTKEEIKYIKKQVYYKNATV